MKTERAVTATALLAITVLAARVAPAGTDPAEDPVARLGQQRYARNCAACHGPGGRGDGTFAKLLTVRPSDLTVLARNNGGAFPFDRVYDVIDGRDIIAAHGSRDMPIWGQRYEDVAGDGSETVVRGRILELIIYLGSIQAR
ncbi:MAG: c-type cytochrome [Gammaproteobacteria bacterium]|nr:c-type cytochrome [Gammaproteobacteria bacterium]